MRLLSFLYELIGKGRYKNHMRQKLKRIVCTLLVSVMILGMMPSYTFAEERADTVEKVENGTGQEEMQTSDQTGPAEKKEVTETDRGGIL